jgi:hypothetical protein
VNLSFFANEIAPKIPANHWGIELASYLGEVKHIDISEEDGEARASELEAAGVNQEALQLYASCGDWESVLRLAKEKHLERYVVDYDFPAEVSEEAARLLLDAGLGDGAIRLLTKTHNFDCLARAHVFLGQWPEAISLSRLYSNVYSVIYPRFGQLLFQDGYWFESLICFFIPKDKSEREKALEKMFSAAADACACDELGYIQLMLLMNEPESYWRLYPKCMCYLAAHRLKKYHMVPLSHGDAETVFYLSYFVMACVRAFAIRGVRIADILLQLLSSASILGLKRWVAYAMRELGALELDGASTHLAQRGARPAETPAISCPCPRCNRDFYSSSRSPLLVCGFCGMKMAFSACSCRPLGLVPFEYHGENALELIESQPVKELEEDVIPRELVNEAFLKETPPEYFVIQRLKEKSGVGVQFWFNAELSEVLVCGNCGSLFDRDDFECSGMDMECCPVCRSGQIENQKNMNVEAQSRILDMLRPFAEDSPVWF